MGILTIETRRADIHPENHPPVKGVKFSLQMKAKIKKLLKHPRFIFICLNVLAAICVFILLMVFVLRHLDKYTAHGETISVPVFHSLHPEEVEAVAAQWQLRTQIIDSLYDTDYEPGVILEQYPHAGEQVKANRMIYLTVNASKPEQIVFPEIRNASYRQAMHALRTMGFRIGEIVYEPSNFKNLVLGFLYDGEKIADGSLLNKGAVIDLILGDGNRDNVVSNPELFGMKLRDALTLLKENYLNIGEILPDSTVQTNTIDEMMSFVYDQIPKPDSILYVPAGSRISLLITQDEERLIVLDTLLINP